MTLLADETYLDAIDRDSARLLAVATGNLAKPITFLGDWTVRDLLDHTGRVYSFCVANVLAADTESAPRVADATDLEGDAVIGWFEERRAEVLDTLRNADPDGIARTFAGVRTARFWLRRIAQETVVHRWDAETALGQATPIDPTLARDGVDEYSEISLRFSRSRPNRDYPERTLHLHRTDGEGEWMFARGEDGSVVVSQEHGKGDAAVRGTAENLLLWIWGRPISDVEIFGDPAVAKAWQDVAP